MDTDDIPYGEKLREQWEKWYKIGDEDYEEFERIMVSS
jgi:hypothetical protein